MLKFGLEKNKFFNLFLFVNIIGKYCMYICYIECNYVWLVNFVGWLRNLMFNVVNEIICYLYCLFMFWNENVYWYVFLEYCMGLIMKLIVVCIKNLYKICIVFV